MDNKDYATNFSLDGLHYIEKTDTQSSEYNNNTFFEKLNRDDSLFSMYADKNTPCIPRNLREYLIIEYTAIFANMEGDVVEFYLKMSNGLLKQFPFLHVDHPLHEYYELIKQHPQKRVVNKFPNIIPKPIKTLFDYVTAVEKEQQWTRETAEKSLREKQTKSLIEKENKLKEKQQDQSYSSLFQMYMESDEESDNKKAEEMESKPLDESATREMNNFIQKVNDLNNNSVTSYLKALIKHIENYKFLHFGSAEYEYFKSKISNEEDFTTKESGAWADDFFTFLLKMGEQKDNSETQEYSERPIFKQKRAENEDNVKTMQNFRRERAKMLLHGLQKK